MILLTPRPAQLVDLILHQSGDVVEHLDVARAGDRRKQWGGRADDADPLTALADDGAGHDRAVGRRALPAAARR